MCNLVRWRRRNLRADEVAVISGNSKIGRTPSLSLLPVVTCDRSAPCARRGQCYAHALEFRGGKTWAHNTRLAVDDPRRFFLSLREQFAQRAGRVPFFRWFVAGDIPSRAFLGLLMEFCAEHPETRFLTFTKRYRWVSDWLDQHGRPANVSVILSAWPGHRLHNPHGLPVAWMHDEAHPDRRIPENAIPCPGGCEGCGMCWSLPDIGRDVVFEKH